MIYQDYMHIQIHDLILPLFFYALHFFLLICIIFCCCYIIYAAALSEGNQTKISFTIVYPYTRWNNKAQPYWTLISINCTCIWSIYNQPPETFHSLSTRCQPSTLKNLLNLALISSVLSVLSSCDIIWFGYIVVIMLNVAFI